VNRLAQVVHMYAGIDDDENADNARQGGNGDAGSRSSGSQSTSSSSSDSDSDGDADEGVDADLRRPPKDVSDSGLVSSRWGGGGCREVSFNIFARAGTSDASISVRDSGGARDGP
jgi:hypothetical protein